MRYKVYSIKDWRTKGIIEEMVFFETGDSRTAWINKGHYDRWGESWFEGDKLNKGEWFWTLDEAKIGAAKAKKEWIANKKSRINKLMEEIEEVKGLEFSDASLIKQDKYVNIPDGKKEQEEYYDSEQAKLKKQLLLERKKRLDQQLKEIEETYE